MARPLKIAFLHPDLGIGGAERLVVDAALELKGRGHQVLIYTACHNPERCPAETLGGGLEIRVRGWFPPPVVRNRLRVPCSLMRMSFMGFAMFCGLDAPDLVFCDLVPHVLPLLRRMSQAPLIFYCHYPDLLMTPRREGFYSWYRVPFDWLEQTGMLSADRVLVNSRFTAEVFEGTFPSLMGRLKPEVVYPGIAVEQFASNLHRNPTSSLGDFAADELLLLSLNRFDPRKNLPLAVEAFAHLRRLLPGETFARLRLIVAGGYDARMPENVSTFNKIQDLSRRLGLNDHVHLLRSLNDRKRLDLLRACHCLIYTSPNEHFGIGVVEAMAAGRPVVAVNRAGPCETVLDGVTGYLVEPTPQDFARALARLIEDPELALRLGRAGQRRAEAEFSRSAFGSRLDAIARDMVAHRRGA